VSDIQPAEPTADECSANSVVALPDGRTGYAIWYPTTGGYVGRAVVAPEDGCFEAWVWHDGDFPFSGGDPYRETTSPRRLHHCDPDQFVAFGKTVARLLDDTPSQPDLTA